MCVYVKIPKRFKMLETNNENLLACTLSIYNDPYIDRNIITLKILPKEGYLNNPICPYVFIKKYKSGFPLITLYVDDLNLI